MKMQPRMLNNERGILTLDFLFASILVFSLSAILFSFAMTFSFVEVVQYITYASARNYSLAHLDQDRQAARADEKFIELISHPILQPLQNNGWFEIQNIEKYDFNQDFDVDPSKDSDTFIGKRVIFRAPILYKRVPLFGTTADDPSGFSANIQSFLAREPTFQECREFMETRVQQMQNRFPASFNPAEAVIMMDNGC